MIESNAATIATVRMRASSFPKQEHPKGEVADWKDCAHKADYDRAVRGCTALLNVLPKDQKLAIVFAKRGMAYASKEQHEEAIADFDRAIELEPGRATYHEFRGKSYVLMGQPQRAFDDFDFVIALDPLSDIAYYNRAYAYSIVGQDDRAIQDLNRAIRLKPDEPLHYMLRGDIYADMGQIEKARADHEKALALPARTTEQRKQQEALRGRLAVPEKKFQGQPTIIQPKPAATTFRHGVIRRASGGEAIAPFSVKTNPGAKYFVKLVHPGDSQEQIAGFIVGGQPFSTKVPTGIYELRYAVGQDWINEQDYFGPKTAFYRADKLLVFAIEGDRVLGSEVELILQRGGNLRTSIISKDKF